MSAIITKFWPALIPLLIFGMWYLFIYKPRANKKKGDKLPPHIQRLQTLTLLSSLVIAIVMILVLMVSVDENREEDFVPSRIEDGKLVPGHFEPHKSSGE